MRTRLMFVAALHIAAMGVPVTSAGVEGPRADAGCEAARMLVEENSSDAVGGTREALERGIADLNAALKRGCPDRKAALLTLALGYNTVAYRYAAEGSAECKRFEELRRETHRALGSVAGDDPVALTLYAESLDGAASKIVVYRKITRLAPRDADAHFGLARALILAGRREEAVKSLERALSVADTDRLNRLAPEVDELLREQGLEDDANAMRAVAERRRAVVGTPSGR